MPGRPAAWHPPIYGATNRALKGYREGMGMLAFPLPSLYPFRYPAPAG